MNFAKLTAYSIFLLSTYSFNASAQTSSNLVAPAVWAWEVKTGNRVIYLLGELHGFTSQSNLKIDYQLGKDAYYSSSEIWAEVKQTSTQSEQKISSKLPPELWGNIKSSTRKMTYKLSRRTNTEKEELYLQFIKELDANDPYAAYGNLLSLTELNAKFKNPLIRAYDGMSKVLMSIDANYFQKKISNLESDSSVADIWGKHCNDNKNLEQLMSAALANLDESLMIDKILNSKTQDIFLDPAGTLDSIYELLLNEPAGEILNKCVVVARNKLWLPKILELAKTSGPPVTILVGVAHVSGSEGLLELLKMAGYKDIKRIYSIQ